MWTRSAGRSTPPSSTLTPIRQAGRSTDLPAEEFGFHPLGGWCDETGPALVGMPRPGNAGANTAAVQATFDEGYYPTGVKVTDAELAAIPLKHHDVHPEWNYSVLPAPP